MGYPQLLDDYDNVDKYTAVFGHAKLLANVFLSLSDKFIGEKPRIIKHHGIFLNTIVS